MIKQIDAQARVFSSVARRRLMLLAVGCLPILALAAEPGALPERQADWQQRLDRAATLLQESKARQQTAGEVFEQKKLDCFKEFLVNACQNKAKKEHLLAQREARRLESEGRALEREVRREQLAEQDKDRAAQVPQRKTELLIRQSEAGEAREAAEARRAAILEKKARQAEEGSRRKAAEAEALRRRQAAHAASVARQMREAEVKP